MALVISVNSPAPSPAPGPTGVSEIRTVGAPSIEHQFRALFSQWRSETRVLSSIQSKVFNSNYQRIMAMGKAVLPLIFDDLMNNGGQWYWALECITGDNPAIHAESTREAKEAWLAYAAEHGYLNANERRN